LLADKVLSDPGFRGKRLHRWFDIGLLLWWGLALRERVAVFGEDLLFEGVYNRGWVLRWRAVLGCGQRGTAQVT